jgi:hypothetical protein
MTANFKAEKPRLRPPEVMEIEMSPNNRFLAGAAQ